MQLKDYCLQQLPHVFRDDMWTKDLFKGGSIAAEPLILEMRDFYNSEDFDLMTMERLKWFEDKLGINYPVEVTDDFRRKIVKAYWMNWGKPSTDSVKNILDTIGITYTNVEYRRNTGTVYISLGEDVPDGLFPLAIVAIRRHLPAHIGISFGEAPVSNYMTAKEVSEYTTKNLWNETANPSNIFYTSVDYDDHTVSFNDYYFYHLIEAKEDEE